MQALGSLTDCYVENALGDSHVTLQEEPTERLESFEEIELGTVLVSSSKQKGYRGNNWKVYYVPVQM